MFGDNPKRSPIKGDGSVLEVQEIFPTLQGEGPYVGYPAVFIRLGGCNLACSFCDTEFETFTSVSVDKIVSEVIVCAGADKRNIALVVITGGEPFRQPIEYLCNQLLLEDFIVQIETNGTLYRPINKDVEIVCSPKNTGGGYSLVRSDLLPLITAFKFLVSDGLQAYQNVPDVGQDIYDTPVYVQPMDEYDAVKNQLNMKRALHLAQEKGYALSIQLHKIVGIK